MPAARISFIWRFISKYSRILLYEIAYILLKTDDDLLPDIDVEVDLDRLFGRAYLHASRCRSDQSRCQERSRHPHRDQAWPQTASRQYRTLHLTVSLSLG